MITVTLPIGQVFLNRGKINRELIVWLCENTKNWQWFFSDIRAYFFFKEANDAMMFKLVWGGDVS